MKLKELISKNYMQAFKEKNVVAKNLLSVVKGEIQTIEKNTGTENLSDEEVLKILNKTISIKKIVWICFFNILYEYVYHNDFRKH